MKKLKEKNHTYKIKDFIKIKELGKGSFGKVLLVKNKIQRKILRKRFK